TPGSEGYSDIRLTAKDRIDYIWNHKDELLTGLSELIDDPQLATETEGDGGIRMTQAVDNFVAGYLWVAGGFYGAQMSGEFDNPWDISWNKINPELKEYVDRNLDNDYPRVENKEKTDSSATSPSESITFLKREKSVEEAMRKQTFEEWKEGLKKFEMTDDLEDSLARYFNTLYPKSSENESPISKKAHRTLDRLYKEAFVDIADKTTRKFSNADEAINFFDDEIEKAEHRKNVRDLVYLDQVMAISNDENRYREELIERIENESSRSVSTDKQRAKQQDTIDRLNQQLKFFSGDHLVSADSRDELKQLIKEQEIGFWKSNPRLILDSAKSTSLFPEQSESSLIDNNGQLANLINEMRALKRITTSVALETNPLHPLFENAHVKLNELEQDALMIAELDESPDEMATAFVELSIKYQYLSDAVYSLITESGVKMHLRLNETLNLFPRVDKD